MDQVIIPAVKSTEMLRNRSIQRVCFLLNRRERVKLAVRSATRSMLRRIQGESCVALITPAPVVSSITFIRRPIRECSIEECRLARKERRGELTAAARSLSEPAAFLGFPPFCACRKPDTCLNLNRTRAAKTNPIRIYKIGLFREDAPEIALERIMAPKACMLTMMMISNTTATGRRGPILFVFE